MKLLRFEQESLIGEKIVVYHNLHPTHITNSIWSAFTSYIACGEPSKRPKYTSEGFCRYIKSLPYHKDTIIKTTLT